MTLGHQHPRVGEENRKRFVATGATYKHRITLRKFGWRWNEPHVCWYLDTQDENDEGLRFARAKRGVKVSVLYTVVPKIREYVT